MTDIDRRRRQCARRGISESSSGERPGCRFFGSLERCGSWRRRVCCVAFQDVDGRLPVYNSINTFSAHTHEHAVVIRQSRNSLCDNSVKFVLYTTGVDVPASLYRQGQHKTGCTPFEEHELMQREGSTKGSEKRTLAPGGPEQRKTTISTTVGVVITVNQRLDWTTCVASTRPSGAPGGRRKRPPATPAPPSGGPP